MPSLLVASLLLVTMPLLLGVMQLLEVGPEVDHWFGELAEVWGR